MKKIEKKFEKSSNTEDNRCCQKKSSSAPKHFQKCAEKKGKKTKRIERRPPKSAQKSPVTL